MKYLENKLNTIKVKGGQDYVKVHERIKFFRENYSDYSILTEVKSIENNSVVIKASILDEKRDVRFTGYAYGDINKDKGIEKTETTAVGRALAFAGIGIDEGLASAEEMDRFNNNSGSNSNGNSYNNNNSYKSDIDTSDYVYIFGNTYPVKDTLSINYKGVYDKELNNIDPKLYLWMIPQYLESEAKQHLQGTFTYIHKSDTKNVNIQLLKSLKYRVEKCNLTDAEKKNLNEKSKDLLLKLFNTVDYEKIDSKKVVEITKKIKENDNEVINILKNI